MYVSLPPKLIMDIRRKQRFVQTPKHKRQLRLIRFRTIHGFINIAGCGKNRKQKNAYFRHYKQRADDLRKCVCLTASYIAGLLREDLVEKSWDDEVKNIVLAAIEGFDKIASMERDYTVGEDFTFQATRYGTSFKEQISTYSSLKSYIAIVDGFLHDVFLYHWES